MDGLESNPVFTEVHDERLVVHERVSRSIVGADTHVTSVYLVSGSLETVAAHWGAVMVRLTGDPEVAGGTRYATSGHSEPSEGVVDGDYVTVQVSEVSPLGFQDLFVPQGYVAVEITAFVEDGE